MSMQGGEKMELGKQIKKHRQEAQLSQEELANRVYVSRQTISNWENNKSYPDVNSLVLLSEIFQISLDKLIKGDLDVMKEAIKKEEVEKMKQYGTVYTILLIATVASAMPLFMWLGTWAFIPWGIIFAFAMYFAIKIERIKNFNEVSLGYTYEQAVEEAKRCLNCKNKPCVSSCPVSIQIPDFLKFVSEGKIEEADRVIKQSSCLPAVCGRVCPQETQCEGSCVRGIKGEPVEINQLERFINNWAKEHNITYTPDIKAKQNMKVAIIPFGYADGFDLKFIGIEIVVDNIKCKVLNICMDCFMLDVSNLKVKKGDEIYLLNKFNSLNNYAEYLETSSYEIMTKFSNARAERVVI